MSRSHRANLIGSNINNKNMSAIAVHIGTGQVNREYGLYMSSIWKDL